MPTTYKLCKMLLLAYLQSLRSSYQNLFRMENISLFGFCNSASKYCSKVTVTPVCKCECTGKRITLSFMRNVDSL